MARCRLSRDITLLDVSGPVKADRVRIYEDFWCLFGKMDQKHSENHYVSQSILITFRDLAKVDFSVGKTAFQKTVKSSCENLINTVVYGNF